MEFDILNLLLVVLAAWMGGTIAQRLNYPSVLGELATGIILGPPLLGLLHGGEVLVILGELGILLMMLYIGMEINPRDLSKASTGGLLAALGGYFTPAALGYLAVTLLGGTTLEGLFVGTVIGVTALATSPRILADLNVLNTRVAHVLTAGALISDTLALIAFSAVVSLAGAGTVALGEMASVVGRAVAFFAVTSLVGIKVFPLVLPRLRKMGLTGRTVNMTLVLVIALIFGEMAELAGLHSIIGAFLAGLFLREGVLDRKLSHQIMDVVHDMSMGFLAPIFFVMVGFEVSFGVFQTDLPLLLAVLGVALFGKLIGAAAFYLPSGHGWREAIAVATGMNGRGGVDVIIAGIALQMGVIGQELFTVLIFTAMATTSTVPFLLKWSIGWLQRRGELVTSDDRQGTIIVGAGPFARTLAHVVSAVEPVWVIDKNRIDYEAAVASGLNAIHGDALDPEVMEEANADSASTVIALTTNSEVNLIATQLAKEEYQVPNAYALTNDRDRGVRRLIDDSPTARLFMKLNDLENWDYWIVNNETSQIEAEVERAMTVREGYKWLNEDQTVLPLMVQRNGTTLMYRNADALQPGDRVIALKRLAEKQTIPAGAEVAVPA